MASEQLITTPVEARARSNLDMDFCSQPVALSTQEPLTTACVHSDEVHFARERSGYKQVVGENSASLE